MNGLAIFFLLLFCLVLFASYLAIRRSLLTIRTVGGLCAAGASSTLFAFSLAAELGLLHALITGVVVGLIFSGAVVAMAAFFQFNQPGNELETYLSEQRIE